MKFTRNSFQPSIIFDFISRLDDFHVKRHISKTILINKWVCKYDMEFCLFANLQDINPGKVRSIIWWEIEYPIEFITRSYNQSSVKSKGWHDNFLAQIVLTDLKVFQISGRCQGTNNRNRQQENY